MKKYIRISVCILIMICLGVSCKDVPTSVPIAKVNFTVSIYANGLAHVGGHEYFTGAISGLVVYRVDMVNFQAYDRACPYDWKDGGYVRVDTSNSFHLICGSCQSTFNILDGFSLGQGKTNATLRAYKAVLIDDINLRVSNY